MNNQKEKGALLVALAEIYNFRFSESSMALYLECIKDIPFQVLKEKINSGISEDRWRFMPRPGELIHSSKEEKRSEAVDAASLVWSAISKFGYINPKGAENYVGSLAWRAIQQLGGWVEICKTTQDEKGIFLAQFRDVCEMLVGKSENNTLDQRPTLKGFGHIVKSISA